MESSTAKQTRNASKSPAIDSLADFLPDQAPKSAHVCLRMTLFAKGYRANNLINEVLKSVAKPIV